jgi:hypothetical protein
MEKHAWLGGCYNWCEGMVYKVLSM